MKFLVYVMALVICLACNANVFGQAAGQSSQSTELKSNLEGTEVGRMLQNKAELTFNRLCTTSRLKTRDGLQIEIQAMLVYNTSKPTETPKRGVKLYCGSQSGYIDYDELPGLFKAINYFKKCITLFKNKREHFYSVQYRTKDDLVVGFYQEGKTQFPYFKFDKYTFPVVTTIRRADLDQLIKGVSQAMNILDNYQKEGFRPPMFK